MNVLQLSSRLLKCSIEDPFGSNHPERPFSKSFKISDRLLSDLTIAMIGVLL